MLLIFIIAIAMLVILFTAGVVISGQLQGGHAPNDTAAPEDILARERIFARAATQVLGRYLADLAPGAKALIIVANKARQLSLKPELDSLEEGFAEGLGAPVTIEAIDSPNLRLADPNQDPELEAESLDAPAPSLSECLCAAHFNDLLSRHADCNLVISFIGMPPDLGEMAAWTESRQSRPTIAVAEGVVPMLKDVLLSDAVCAVVVPRDRIHSNQIPPRDVQEAFAQRYLLATPDNVEELSAQYTRLFTE